MKAKGNSKITIIQGDSYTKKVQFLNLPVEIIDKVYFSCSQLGLSKQLFYDIETNKYEINLSSDETVKFQNSFRGTYDLTVYFVGEQTNCRTAVYNGAIEVLPKVNKVLQ